MIWKPVQLGREALDRSELEADRKSCKRFGPCGVGERALYLGGLWLDCRYYIPYGEITRVFKRVAMSKGGFSHKGLFASVAYLVVEYGGQEKQCTFKLEEQVDQLLAFLKQRRPELRLVSARGEQRLREQAAREARRPKPVLSEEAQAALRTLEEARALLEQRPELCQELSNAARARRELTLIAQRRRNGAIKRREQDILTRADAAKQAMADFLASHPDFPLPARYAHPIVLLRMERVVREGRAAAIDQALEAVKADLKALNSSVEVSQEEHDEVVAVKAMFLNENYR